MDANYILKNADDLRFTITLRLDNTLTQEYGFEDTLGGGYAAIGGSRFDGVDYLSNAAVAISNMAALNGPSHEIVSGGLTLTQRLEGQFSPTSEPSYGNVRILNTSADDEFSLRSWMDKEFEVKVGGTIDKGTDLEQTLTFDEYEIWFNGRVSDFTVNKESIDLTLVPLASELLAPLPLNSFKSGASKGKPIPYIIGSVKGMQPEPEGGGLFKFHDGEVYTIDPIQDQRSSESDDTFNGERFDLFPAVSVGENQDYFHELTLSQYQESGVVTAVPNTISWTQISNTKVEETTALDMAIVCDDVFTLTADGTDVYIENAADDFEGYTSDDFSWSIDGNGFKTDKGLPITVELGGDIIPTSVGGRWFKFEADGTGAVTFTFPKELKRTVMIIRSLTDGVQTVDTFSIEPDSVNPPIPSGDDVNHRVTYSSLDSKTLSFVYTSTSDAEKVAVWFEDIQISGTATGSFSIEKLGDNTELELTTTTTNASQVIHDDACDPLVDTCDLTEVSLIPLTIGSGRVKITATSYTVSSDIYDAIYDKEAGLLSMSPPSPVGATSSPTVLSASSRLTPLLVSEGIDPLNPTLPPIENEEDTIYRIEARVRVANSSLVNVKSLLTSYDGERTVTVGQDWQTLTADVNTDTTIAELYLAAWRGIFPAILPGGSPVSDLENDDVEHALEFDFFRAYPINHNSERIRVFIPSDNGREEIPCYRVSDASLYKDGLPPTIALYDSTGRVCVSPIYNKIIIHANGGEEIIEIVTCIRKMSNLAINRDAIDTSLTPNLFVGVLLKEQKPAIEYIKEVLSTSDYFYTENLDDDNITVRRRFNYQNYPVDFAIDNLESASRTGSELRERQYIVEYDRDYGDPALSKNVKSSIGVLSDVPAKTLTTALANFEENAQYVADLINRDSSDNGIYQSKLLGIGHGHEVGDAGVLTDPNIPPNRPAIIRSVQQSTSTRMTTIDAKVLQRSS